MKGFVYVWPMLPDIASILRHYCYIILPVWDRHNLQTSNQYGCIPWNFPHPDANMPLCTRNAAGHFASNISDFDYSSKCDHCAPDCDSFQYDVVVDSMKLNPSIECSKRKIRVSSCVYCIPHMIEARVNL